MRNIKIGDKLQIHCYKHNGKLYRTCDEATILDIQEDFIVCANNKTEIIECQSIDSTKYHKYFTKEPAILFFFKNNWFNVIAQLKQNGTFYYCNIATPYIIDDGLIKYIDYDLDLRIYPDGGFKVLDRNEYRYHKNKFNYDEALDTVIQYELNKLINLYKTHVFPFDKETAKKYHNIYKNIKRFKDNSENIF